MKLNGAAAHVGDAILETSFLGSKMTAFVEEITVHSTNLYSCLHTHEHTIFSKLEKLPYLLYKVQNLTEFPIKLTDFHTCECAQTQAGHVTF